MKLFFFLIFFRKFWNYFDMLLAMTGITDVVSQKLSADGSDAGLDRSQLHVAKSQGAQVQQVSPFLGFKKIGDDSPCY